MNITKVSLILEIDGDACLAVIKNIDLVQLCKVIAIMNGDETLKVVKLPDAYFEAINYLDTIKKQQ